VSTQWKMKLWPNKRLHRAVPSATSYSTEKRDVKESIARTESNRVAFDVIDISTKPTRVTIDVD
jgi:hypothetical protein